VVQDEDALATPAVTSTTTYELLGDSLSFTTVTNSCPDQVAETILTSRPWERVPLGAGH
jgi:hypothetical protein